MKKLEEAEALVRYSIRYYQPQGGCWTRMDVRANLSKLLDGLEPEDAHEVREALKDAVTTTMLCFNGGIGHGKPRVRDWIDFKDVLDTKLQVKLSWKPGVLTITSTRIKHANLIRESVRCTLAELDLTSQEIEQYERVLQVAATTA
ncbi:MAG: hypothetical protein ABIG32_01150 [Candidatus Uhrbacteria bacterium]|nr:hypothetical protein [Patescibacteria group bacterium]MBU1906667.1 hypothetical protein [Patescibacteria group bacterium]